MKMYLAIDTAVVIAIFSSDLFAAADPKANAILKNCKAPYSAKCLYDWKVETTIALAMDFPSHKICLRDTHMDLSSPVIDWVSSHKETWAMDASDAAEQALDSLYPCPK